MVNKTMIILDTTLREGEQTPNVSFTVDEKIRLAQMLDEFGVEMIEAGHPSVSNQVYEAVKKIASENLNAEIVAHVRAVRSDIDTALTCDVDRIVIFLATSQVHLSDKLHFSQEKALDVISTEIQYAKDHGLNIRYTPEDSTRTGLEFLIKACQTAVEAGADRISIADTVGISTPKKFSNLIAQIHQNVNAKIDVHCHNDFGLALANALAAVESGADCVHTTVNGLGERVGIVDLASLATSYSILLQNKTHYKLENLKDISSYVEKISGIYTAPNAPIVGETAFTHKSGVHTDGILKNPTTYEPFDPSLLGRERSIAVDKYTGKLAVEKKLSDYGITGLSSSEILEIVYKIKELGDRKKIILDGEILEIYEQVTGKNGFIIPQNIEAIINLNLLSNVYTTNVVRKVNTIPGVDRIYEIVGENDISVHVAVNAINRLNSLIEEIRTIQGISSTNTKIILKKFNGNGNTISNLESGIANNANISRSNIIA
jgi:homocitrate synthase